MDARVLPVRFPPLHDELLSSWFVRLAHANGEKAQSLAFRIFGRECNFIGSGDLSLDRGQDVEAIKTLARITRTEEHRVAGATLSAYVGYLWDEIAARGARRWVMPVMDRSHVRSGHGLQACAGCLHDDATPYFRRSWRLSLQVMCPYHQRILLDHCPECNAPLVIHRGDVGVFTPSSESSVRWCCRCGVDLAETSTVENMPPDLVEFQALLLRALQRGWVNVGGRVVHSVLFFEGLRMLWAFLDAPAWSAAVRSVLERHGILLVGSRVTRYGGIDVQRTDARHSLLSASNWLLTEWPDRFLTVAGEARVSSRHLLHFSMRGQAMTPFWLWEPVHKSLDRTMYVPPEEEIANAFSYLLRVEGQARHRDVCRLLNMKTNHSLRVMAVMCSLRQSMAHAVS